MHHEQYSKFQSDYKSDVIALVGAFEQVGNPLLEYRGELIGLGPVNIYASGCGRQCEKSERHRISAAHSISQHASQHSEAFTATLHKTYLKLFKASLSEPRRKSEVSVI